LVWSEGKQQQKKQIPCGNDRKKSKDSGAIEQRGKWFVMILKRNGRCAVLAVAVLGTMVSTAVASDVATAKPALARIKDIASIEGIRDNQLVGYGIVVGLQGTGDSQQTTFPVQTLVSTLLRMGVSVPAGSIRVQNLAAVFVSASLPAFADSGAKIDVTASSAGDAKSLEGGVLLMTPLYGADGRIYAQAQGALVVGGYSVASNGSSRTVNHTTTARIPQGAMVERASPTNLGELHSFNLLLNEADFRSAEAMSDAVSREVPGVASQVRDSGHVEVRIPMGQDVPAMLAKIEAIEVPFFPRAKVIVNERTGTVVIGGTVTLQPVSILHGGLSVNVVTNYKVSQPNALSSGTTATVAESKIDVKDQAVNRIELREGATVEELVRDLQQIGATARDVISILQAMQAAGALGAEIEVL
jgi:flagellar P-ring protein FlgI